MRAVSRRPESTAAIADTPSSAGRSSGSLAAPRSTAPGSPSVARKAPICGISVSRTNSPRIEGATARATTIVSTKLLAAWPPWPMNAIPARRRKPDTTAKDMRRLRSDGD